MDPTIVGFGVDFVTRDKWGGKTGYSTLAGLCVKASILQVVVVAPWGRES